MGRYELRYDDFNVYNKFNRTIYGAQLSVFNGGEPLGILETQRRVYVNAEQPTTEVALRTTLRDDLYVTMPGIGQNQEITLKAAVNPLLVWGWIGGALMVVGGVVAIIPERKRRIAS